VEEPGRLTEQERKGEGGARAVLIAWARALERKDFAEAQSLFSQNGSRRIDYSERLGGFDTITVAAPIGRMEAAAGTVRYASPVTVTGIDGSGRRTKLQGPIVLRRANDVPGASPEQLSWKIESVELRPVP
jgi:hypothetical protein